MSGNLQFLFYSRLKTFFNATTCTSNLLWGVTQYITCFTIQLINNQRNKWKLNHFHKHFCLQLQLKIIFGLFKWWLTFRSTTCTVRCGDQQLRFTHCTYGLFQFGSAESPWNTTVIPAGGEGTLFSKLLCNYSEKGMRWSRMLWKTILIKATSSSSITSSFAIQKDHVGVFNHIALALKDTWMRLELAPRGRINVNWHHKIRPKHPSSCNSAGGRIAKLLLVETRDVH